MVCGAPRCRWQQHCPGCDEEDEAAGDDHDLVEDETCEGEWCRAFFCARHADFFSKPCCGPCGERLYKRCAAGTCNECGGWLCDTCDGGEGCAEWGEEEGHMLEILDKQREEDEGDDDA